MDADLLRQLEALPLPKATPKPGKTTAGKTRKTTKPSPNIAQERFERYAGDLAEEVRRLKSEVASTKERASKYDEVKKLVKTQVKVLSSSKAENDRLEAKILRTLGLPNNSKSHDTDD